MRQNRNSLREDRKRRAAYTSLFNEWNDRSPDHSELPHLFDRLVQQIRNDFDISKGFLATREKGFTHFMAIAAFKGDQGCRKLSLKLPPSESLFEKVAESERLFSENYSELFDGNRIEKRLLLDDDSVSYLLRPLKQDGQLVGLIGFSSESPDTFVTFELGHYDEVFDRFGELLGRLQPSTTPA